jgi:hypothetical protein
VLHKAGLEKHFVEFELNGGSKGVKQESERPDQLPTQRSPRDCSMQHPAAGKLDPISAIEAA